MRTLRTDAVRGFGETGPRPRRRPTVANASRYAARRWIADQFLEFALDEIGVTEHDAEKLFIHQLLIASENCALHRATRSLRGLLDA